MAEKAAPYGRARNTPDNQEILLLKRLVEAVERIAREQQVQSARLETIASEMTTLRRDGNLFRTPRAGGM